MNRDNPEAKWCRDGVVAATPSAEYKKAAMDLQTCVMKAIGNDPANPIAKSLKVYIAQMVGKLSRKHATLLLSSLKTSPSTLLKSSSHLLRCMASAGLPSKKNKLARFGEYLLRDDRMVDYEDI
eukprot:scaffold10642_cov155-Skeletonema_dohrnii-CCMP3373.AAC.2